MNIKATPVFQRNWNSTKKIVINRGGTRSSKTVSLLQLMLVWLMTGKIDDTGKIFDTGIVTIVRKEKTTLKATAIRDWEEVIVNAGCEFLLNEEHRNMTDKIYKYKGRVVEFIGADDQQKLRGGKRDILYCNEANSLNYDQEFFQLFIRTTYKTFIDFNPDNEDVWINVELEQKRQYDEGDVEIIVSTYKDNPFLPEQQVKEIERLEKVNPHYWKIYGLGEYGKLEGVIFNNWTVCEDVPEHAQLVGYGMDFGYTNDPTTLVALYQGDNSIYVDEIIYETGLTNLDIDAMIVSLGLDKSDKFVADSAEPKSIEELYRRGINIHPCVKGKDSITYGIDLMKQFQFKITSQSTNTIREFKSYCWDQDKDGKRLNKPIGGNDHCFTGDTMITTNKGQKRIDKIKVGDKVLTRYGYKKVLKVFDNGLQQTYNYLLQGDIFSVQLRSTLYHNIYTDQGTTMISELKLGQMVYLNKNLTERNIICMLEKDIFQNQTKECIQRYGFHIIEKYLKAITSTIKMVINGIMRSTTLNVKKDQNICQNIRKNIVKIIEKGLLRIGITLDTLQNNDIHQMNENNDIENIEKTHETIEQNIQIKIVNGVENDIKQDTNDHQSSVIKIAKLQHLEKGEEKLERVYDLMIEDYPEYFANGLLVHNSIDAIRYCVIDRFDTRIKKKERVAKDTRPRRNYLTGELEYR